MNRLIVLWGASPLTLSCDAAQAYQGARGWEALEHSQKTENARSETALDHSQKAENARSDTALVHDQKAEKDCACPFKNGRQKLTMMTMMTIMLRMLCTKTVCNIFTSKRNPAIKMH
jgi:hypothetical protein